MKRTYVIGFDGATWRFIRPLVERGEMPNFQRLMEQGSYGELMSTIPFQSAAAWVTFMTGKNSGQHGVYMFQDYDATSYSYVGRTANSRYFSGQTIFDVVGRFGGKVTAIRVPMTYPAWPIDGMMVSGFPTPGDTPDSFYPPELRDELGSSAQPEQSDFRNLSTEEQAATLEAQMGRLSELVSRLMDRDHDLFMVVHRISDEVHHFFIGFVDPRTPAYDAEKAAKYGDLVNHFYRKMDETLGETLDRLGPDDTIIVLSDHGGNITPPRQFNLNVWLAEQGLLTPKQAATSLKSRIYALNQKLLPAPLRSTLRQRAPKAVRGELRQAWKDLQEIDYAHTQAYHFPMKCPPLVGVVINREGRQEQGIVTSEDYEQLRERIMRDLLEIRDPRTGEKVVKNVFKREELYNGPYVERAPDIVVWCHEMYKEGPLATGPLIGEVPYDELVQVPGSHDEKGIFLAMGPGIEQGTVLEGARLIDVPPTILHAMELPVPSDMDGHVLTEIFTERERAIASVDLGLSRQSTESHLSDDEEQLIKEKLRGWGYL
ncbi:MAG TPA: alkaline phosphatase family protein [Chloroflexota bacterium]|nr:alkaline phosphatase family protein [Chloroflexota bacterium]